MRNYLFGCAAALIALSPVPASAGEYLFSFSGGGKVGSGKLITTGSPFASRGQTAVTITGITGMINGLNITGLNGFVGSDNLYYLSGPSFLDGSGVGFTASDGSQSSLFYQDSANSYRLTTLTGGFASPFVTATSSVVAAAAVPEPATWAMMLLGFGAIGFAVRRRDKLKATVSFA